MNSQGCKRIWKKSDRLCKRIELSLLSSKASSSSVSRLLRQCATSTSRRLLGTFANSATRRLNLPTTNNRALTWMNEGYIRCLFRKRDLLQLREPSSSTNKNSTTRITWKHLRASLNFLLQTLAAYPEAPSSNSFSRNGRTFYSQSTSD